MRLLGTTRRHQLRTLEGSPRSPPPTRRDTPATAARGDRPTSTRTEPGSTGTPTPDGVPPAPAADIPRPPMSATSSAFPGTIRAYADASTRRAAPQDHHRSDPATPTPPDDPRPRPTRPTTSTSRTPPAPSPPPPGTHSTGPSSIRPPRLTIPARVAAPTPSRRAARIDRKPDRRADSARPQVHHRHGSQAADRPSAGPSTVARPAISHDL